MAPGLIPVGGGEIRQRLAAAVSVLALVSGACGDTDAEPAEGDRARFARFAAQMDRLRELLMIPGMSVAVVRDQEVVWAEGFGWADLAEDIPATPDTPYPLASVTKPLAATVLMQLVEGGALALDDTVDRFGVELDRSGEIEVRHLLSHTSEGNPGEVHSYNGNRYGELGRVIESVTGQTFRSVMYDRLIEPLGMTRTAGNVPGCGEIVGPEVGAAEEVVRRERAISYQLDLSYQIVESAYHTFYSPAAGLTSSVVDLAAFDIALDQGRLLGDAARSEMLAREIPTVPGSAELGYGLGWYVQDHEGTRLLWHFGHGPPSL